MTLAVINILVLLVLIFITESKEVQIAFFVAIHAWVAAATVIGSLKKVQP